MSFLFLEVKAKSFIQFHQTWRPFYLLASEAKSTDFGNYSSGIAFIVIRSTMHWSTSSKWCYCWIWSYFVCCSKILVGALETWTKRKVSCDSTSTIQFSCSWRKLCQWVWCQILFLSIHISRFNPFLDGFFVERGNFSP